MSLVKLLIGLGLLALLGATGIHWTNGAQKAEQKLLSAAEQQLLEADQPWVRMAIDGQRIEMKGFAPSQEAYDQAIHAINKSSGLGGPLFGGITVIDPSLTKVYQGFSETATNENLDDDRITPDAFIWRVDVRNETVSLSGHVPTEATKKLILSTVKDQFKDYKIEDTTAPAIGVDEGAWLVTASTSLRALASLENGTIEANGTKFKIVGTADNAEVATSAQQIISGIRPPFEASAIISVKGTTPILRDVQSIPGTNNNEQTGPQSLKLSSFEQCQAAIDRVMFETQISFATGQSIIEPISRSALDNIASVIGRCENIMLNVEGHTDSSGYIDENIRLSTQRASVVMAYLIRKGVPAEIVNKEGFGSSRPIATNATVAGRASNRRIEFVVTEFVVTKQ